MPLTSELTTYTYPFTANLTFPADGSAPGQLAFHLGKSVSYDFCITDVSLKTTATPPPPYQPETGPRVRVNQVGYVPEGPKRATLVTDATAALPWELHDASDAVVADRHHHAQGHGRLDRPERPRHRLLRRDHRGRRATRSSPTARRAGRSTSTRTSTSSCARTRSTTSTSPAPARRSTARSSATSTPARPGTSGSHPTRATPRCRASVRATTTTAGPATTRSTSRAAGTTPATTASTSSTAASRSRSCSAPTSGP